MYERNSAPHMPENSDIRRVKYNTFKGKRQKCVDTLLGEKCTTPTSLYLILLDVISTIYLKKTHNIYCNILAFM